MNRFCFLIWMMTVPVAAHSQKFDAGLVAGLNASQVDGDQISGFNKIGLTAGGFVNRKLSTKLSLQFELLYSQKGSRKPLNTDDITYFLLRLNYVEVPLLAVYSVGKKWNLEAGVTFATLVGVKEEDQLGEITNSPEFYKNDYLLAGGGNYQLTEHLILDIRYSYSMATIRPKNLGYDYYYSWKGQFNKVVTVALAYEF